MLYWINLRTNYMKQCFHMVCIPTVGILTAFKTIAQNKKYFYLNESFASWILMMLLGAFSSKLQWYQVVAINCVCFNTYIIVVFYYYGINNINNDFFVHIPTVIIISTCLIRMNEVNLRNTFKQLNNIKL